MEIETKSNRLSKQRFSLFGPDKAPDQEGHFIQQRSHPCFIRVHPWLHKNNRQNSGSKTFKDSLDQLTNQTFCAFGVFCGLKINV